jgi:hypothetical protein
MSPKNQILKIDYTFMLTVRAPWEMDRSETFEGVEGGEREAEVPKLRSCRWGKGFGRI